MRWNETEKKIPTVNDIPAAAAAAARRKMITAFWEGHFHKILIKFR